MMLSHDRGDGSLARSPLAVVVGFLASGRSPRVCLLVSAIVLLSLVDLYLTMTFLTNGGMLESNPLARLVISYGSPGVLVLWKFASVALAAFILLRARRHGAAEIGAWVGVLILAWLSVQWLGYVHHTGDLHRVASTMDADYMRHATNGRWVSLSSPGLLATETP